MRPYRVKVPKIVWAENEIAALDAAEKEYGARPKKAVLDEHAHLPRWLYDIAQPNGWCSDGMRHPIAVTYLGKKWIGDGYCVLLAPEGAATDGFKTAVTDSAVAGVLDPWSKAKPQKMVRRRTYCQIGYAMVDMRFIRVVEHFFGTEGYEWRASGDLAPVFAVRDGQPIACVMPTREPPRDAEAKQIADRLHAAEAELERTRKAMAKKAEIEAAVKDKPKAEDARLKAYDRFAKLQELAGMAPLLDEKKAAALEAEVEQLRGRLTAIDEAA